MSLCYLHDMSSSLSCLLLLFSLDYVYSISYQSNREVGRCNKLLCVCISQFHCYLCQVYAMLKLTLLGLCHHYGSFSCFVEWRSKLGFQTCAMAILSLHAWPRSLFCAMNLLFANSPTLELLILHLISLVYAFSNVNHGLFPFHAKFPH